jgi:hypothetical protein
MYLLATLLFAYLKTIHQQEALGEGGSQDQYHLGAH